MKTIKQIADEIGVGNQAVYKRINGSLRSELQPFIHKYGNSIVIDDFGIIIIKKAFGVDEFSSTEASGSDISIELVSMLRKELEKKDIIINNSNDIIQNLMRQNEKLVETLNKQQSLHAGTIQHQLQTEKVSSATVPQKTSRPMSGTSLNKKKRRSIFDFFSR